MKKWPFFRDGDPDPKKEREIEEPRRDAELNALAGDGGGGPRGLAARRPAWAIWTISLSLGAFLWIAVMGFVGSNRLEKRAQLQTESAAVWMKAWDPRVSQIQVDGTAECPSGPSPICARVSVGRMDLGGNHRVEAVWFWPEQNWAKAWLPLAQWRVAHAVTLSAPESEYGKMLIERGSQGVLDSPGRARGLPSTAKPAGLPSWRMGYIVGPAASRVANYRDDGQAPWPVRVMSESGPVMDFPDGMELPAMEKDGQWYVLAQGTAAQAGRLALAFAESVDETPVSDAGPTAAPEGWRWRTTDESLGLAGAGAAAAAEGQTGSEITKIIEK